MNLQDRVQEYLRYMGINAKTFELNVGLSNGACAKLNETIRKSTCNRISKAYPELNIEWLLTGDGPMLKKSTLNVVENTTNSGSIKQTAQLSDVRLEVVRLKAENAILKEQNGKLLELLAGKK